MTRVRLSSYVEADLDEIAAWIAQRNPARAASFIQDLRGVFLRLSEAPLLYRLRPEIGDDARIAVFGRHVILFRVAEDEVRIERVVFGGRDLPRLLK